MNSSTFGVQNNDFVWNGEPVRIMSGALHYFRVVPDYWRDRLLKLKACGLNTVETYIPWNLHEPKEGTFNFEGMADVVSFLTLAGELGLHVIVRPSPYICAEWEFGGLPAWLLADSNVRLRSNDPVYLSKVEAYYDVLLPLLRPLQCTNGGPIIAMQIENEYGSYGNDKAYLQAVKKAMQERGIDVLLFTSDGPEDFMLQGGTIPGVLATVNFGSHPKEAFAKLHEYQPEGPLMVMEFWNGWFDHWMEEHHTRTADDTAQTIADILESGASFNLYMFHGGTNFGFYNGANHINAYEPTVGSYDYNALLSEHGVPTDKYFAVREVIGRFAELPPLSLPDLIPTADYGQVALTESAALFDSLEGLSSPLYRSSPEPMEKLGQTYGFILYSTTIPGPRQEMELVLQQVSDRALVYGNGRYLGTIERWSPSTLPLSVPPEGLKLDILVENMGRINYGPLLRDPKGITEGVRHGNQFLYGWTIHPLPLEYESLGKLDFAPVPGNDTAADQGTGSEIGGTPERPVFYRGTFEVKEKADTFLRLDGWTKGVAYVNGFNLGRYWNAGPQRTLYIPAPLLKEGRNELVVFELHGCARPEVRLADQPDLG
ncbi:glycoside hydrolase family 35 protein [Paenibacillus physcomitrellae]|uniref:Beta-galactosidase n=1 Tax=Paenibacillus physcomitrellae TaxID=1619311 RepID=A0ABQ1FRA4_9BACL|nr:beta-galactosidase family protein [Paenibacillus physcomitrellae]GGA26474.1 beta-galactosidase [Paenibacillus physcomitrellae]